MNVDLADRTAKWLVGDRLACVLHLGDTSLAYQLAEQGHEVTIVDSVPLLRRHDQIGYVRVDGQRLPFTSESFDVVVTPDLRQSPTALAEHARVLRADGLLSTISTTYDDSIPWLRKLREIIGDRAVAAPDVDTFTASGLFTEPETSDFGSWEKLDLPQLMTFARSTMDPSLGEDSLHRVRDLFTSYGAQTGFLRLRHQTTCHRARVVKDNVPQDLEPPDTLLLELR